MELTGLTPRQPLYLPAFSGSHAVIRAVAFFCFSVSLCAAKAARAETFEISEDDHQITIVTPQLEASIRKQGYVSGVAAGSLKDTKTGFRDAGFGLDIVDWVMEPGSDEAYRDQLDAELVYRFNTPYHGKTPKRSIEGPQICTQAKELSPEIIRGGDFVGVRTSYHPHLEMLQRFGLCKRREREVNSRAQPRESCSCWARRRAYIGTRISVLPQRRWHLRC